MGLRRGWALLVGDVCFLRGSKACSSCKDAGHGDLGLLDSAWFEGGQCHTSLKRVFQSAYFLLV